jgi:hypothetical protein
VQEKRQKQVAAAYAWSAKTKHKALMALLSYSQFRRTHAQQTIAARHHCVMTRKACLLAAWRDLARYLVPIRRTLDVLTSKVGQAWLHVEMMSPEPILSPADIQVSATRQLVRAGRNARLMCDFDCVHFVSSCVLQRHHRSRRQLFAAWRLVCHQSALLRMAKGRAARRTLANSFMGWRDVTSIKNRRRHLLQVRIMLSNC